MKQISKGSIKLGIVVCVLLFLGIGIGIMVKAIRKASENPNLLAKLNTDYDVNQDIATLVDQGPKPWDEDDFEDAEEPEKVELRLVEGLPTLIHESQTLNLMPNAKQLALSWSLQRIEKYTVFVGTGTLAGEEVLFTWTFADNNPQARFAFKFLGASPSHTTKSSPEHTTQNLHDTASSETTKNQGAASSASQIKLQWELPAVNDSDVKKLSFRFSNGTYSSSKIKKFDDKTKRFVTYFDTYWNFCGAEQRSGSMTLTITPKDSGPIPTIETLPLAFVDPMTVPIFFFPSVDQVPRNTVAQTSEILIKQVRALLYGHSNPEDPRYGTSGILNTLLAATIVVPPTFRVSDIAEQIQVDRRVEFEASSPWTSGETSVSAGRSCGPKILFSLHDISGATNYAQITTNQLVYGMAQETSVDLVNDGSFRSFSEALFKAAEAHPTDDDSSVTLIGRAVLVSRNPLVEQSRQSLLEPARYGEWQVSDQFAQMLATMGDTIKYDAKAPLKESRFKTLGEARDAARISLELTVWYRPDGYEIRGFRQGSEGDGPSKLLIIGENIEAGDGATLTPDGLGRAILTTTDGVLKYTGDRNRWLRAISWEIGN